MNPVPALLVGTLLLGDAARADDVTYRQDIRPLWEQKCMACHGEAFVGWPDSGALMRRLDDGRHTKDGEPGNMYQHLGADERERQENLALFKAWVGEKGWVLKRFDELTRKELGRMRVAE